jgi:hypothetical protein
MANGEFFMMFLIAGGLNKKYKSATQRSREINVKLVT